MAIRELLQKGMLGVGDVVEIRNILHVVVKWTIVKIDDHHH